MINHLILQIWCLQHQVDNLTPKWETTDNEPACKGGAVIYSPFDVGVYGADKPELCNHSIIYKCNFVLLY